MYMFNTFQLLVVSLFAVCIRSQETTTEPLPAKCTNSNPLESCYQVAQAEINAAGSDLPAYCKALVKYIKCVEDAACDCRLGLNIAALTGITRYNQLFQYYNCSSALNEALQTSPGFNCPGGEAPGDPEVEGLLVFSLDTLDQVINLEDQCPGIQPCYKAYSDAAGIALYRKSLRPFCSAIEDFLPCYENATCTCGQNNNTQIIGQIDAERQLYNQYCTILTNGVYFAEGIQCEGDKPIDVCKTDNPVYDCFSQYEKDTFNAAGNMNVTCPALKEYLNCSESTACKCGLTKSSYILQELTTAHSNYDYLNCSKVSGAVEIKFGINCPESGTTENEVLETLGLLESNIVLKEIQDCHTFEKCYKIYDSSTAKGLYEKNATAVCKSSREFIHCLEQALCLCGRYGDPYFQTELYKQKLVHRNLCPPDSVIENFSCDACAISINQNLNNPIARCLSNYEEHTKPAPKDKSLVCPAYKNYLKCVEGTACSCGLKKSTSILETLTLAHSYYNSNGCSSISGDFPIKFGINCPHNNTNGNADNERLTTLGILESEATMSYVAMCPSVKQCIVKADADTATALYEKNKEDFCRVGSIYVHCIEDTECGCENTQFQQMVEVSKKQHLSLCLDASFLKAATCGSNMIQISSLTLLSICFYLLVSIF